jgi:(2Fe-2S) ferredoxin
MPPRTHLFVCTNRRPDGGRPACGDRGGVELLAAVTAAVLQRGAGARIAVTSSGCLGPCFDGPNAVDYPVGRWWSGLDASHSDELAAVLGGDDCTPALADRLRNDDDA